MEALRPFLRSPLPMGCLGTVAKRKSNEKLNTHGLHPGQVSRHEPASESTTLPPVDPHQLPFDQRAALFGASSTSASHSSGDHVNTHSSCVSNKNGLRCGTGQADSAESSSGENGSTLQGLLRLMDDSDRRLDAMLSVLAKQHERRHSLTLDPPNGPAAAGVHGPDRAAGSAGKNPAKVCSSHIDDEHEDGLEAWYADDGPAKKNRLQHFSMASVEELWTPEIGRPDELDSTPEKALREIQNATPSLSADTHSSQAEGCTNHSPVRCMQLWRKHKAGLTGCKAPGNDENRKASERLPDNLPLDKTQTYEELSAPSPTLSQTTRCPDDPDNTLSQTTLCSVDTLDPDATVMVDDKGPTPLEEATITCATEHNTEAAQPAACQTSLPDSVIEAQTELRHLEEMMLDVDLKLGDHTHWTPAMRYKLRYHLFQQLVELNRRVQKLQNQQNHELTPEQPEKQLLN